MSPDGSSAQRLGRLTAGALYVALMGGAWDFWWHGTMRWETFWSPPHLLIQGGVLIAMAAGITGWVRARDRGWMWLTAALGFVPLIAVLDSLWHRLFGVEEIGTILVFWSPPHLALMVAGGIALILALGRVRGDGDPVARTFSISLLVAGILFLLFYYGYPLEPLGPFHLIGFAGTGVLAAALALSLLAARRLNPVVGSATTVVAFHLVLSMMQFVERPGQGVIVPPYAYPPGWLYVFAFVLPAASADLLPQRWPRPILGGCIGGLYALTLYAFASPYLPAPFRYGPDQAWVAIAAGVIGGIIGGLPFRASRGIREMPARGSESQGELHTVGR